MKRLIAGIALFALSLAAQQTQPALLNTPVQYNPQNFVQGAAGNAAATVTITGVAGQRIRIYSIAAICGTAGTSLVPTIVVNDSNTPSNPPISIATTTISGESNPIRFRTWFPGFAISVGGTATIYGNYGGACTGGTTLLVEADQF